MLRTRSLAGIVAVTTGLLVAAALASRAHPLSGGAASASERTTDLLLVLVFGVVAALIVALAIESHRPDSNARRRLGVGGVLVALALVAAVLAGAYGLGRAFHSSSSGQSRRRGVPCVKYERAHGAPTSSCAQSPPAPVAERAPRAAHARSRFPWPAIGTIVALLAGGGAFFGLDRRRPSAPRAETDDDRRGAVVVALDLSIDGLRRDPDAARAIVAAYARMEAAFSGVGLPRRPAEAPHEFLVRSLHELAASAGAATRLTELFELAKFSHHPATLTMRDEAIAALVAVRDDLTG